MIQTHEANPFTQLRQNCEARCATRIVHIIEDDPEATEELESVLADEPDMLLHVTQRLRDKRDIAAARAALVAELEGQGNAIVEDAGHYADKDALYVSAANRADGEPATEDDAKAYVI